MSELAERRHPAHYYTLHFFFWTMYVVTVIYYSILFIPWMAVTFNVSNPINHMKKEFAAVFLNIKENNQAYIRFNEELEEQLD